MFAFANKDGGMGCFKMIKREKEKKIQI